MLHSSLRLVAAIASPPAGATWVHVGDRGSDIFPFFAACRAQGAQVLLRAAQDRCISTAAGEAAYLCPAARALPARPKTTMHPARTARDTTLAVGWAPITVQPPSHSRQQKPLPAWLMHTWNLAPPPEDPEPLEWVLLTTQPDRKILARPCVRRRS